MAPVAYTAPQQHHHAIHHGPPQPPPQHHLHAPQPQTYNQQIVQQQTLNALNGVSNNINNMANNNALINHPHHILTSSAPASSVTGIKHRPVSKRGVGNALADAVVPQHAHGHGGVLNLSDQSSVVSGLTNRIKPRAPATIDDIARRVRIQSDRFQRMLMPAAESLKTFAESSPVLFTFFAIFMALSAIPFMVFIGFVTAVAVFSTGLSLIFLCFSLSGTILLGLTFLVPVLIVTGTIAFLTVALLLGLFLLHRLYLHVSDAAANPANEGRTPLQLMMLASRTWWDETRSRVGLGPYTYAVTAFEDYKAWEPKSAQSQAKPLATAAAATAPRIVYDEITDYSKHHPQPTPSFPRAVKAAEHRNSRELELAPRPARGDVFAPGSVRSTDTVIRRDDDADWSTDDEGQ